MTTLSRSQGGGGCGAVGQGTWDGGLGFGRNGSPKSARRIRTMARRRRLVKGCFGHLGIADRLQTRKLAARTIGKMKWRFGEQGIVSRDSGSDDSWELCTHGARTRRSRRPGTGVHDRGTGRGAVWVQMPRPQSHCTSIGIRRESVERTTRRGGRLLPKGRHELGSQLARTLLADMHGLSRYPTAYFLSGWGVVDRGRRRLDSGEEDREEEREARRVRELRPRRDATASGGRARRCKERDRRPTGWAGDSKRPKGGGRGRRRANLRARWEAGRPMSDGGWRVEGGIVVVARARSAPTVAAINERRLLCAIFRFFLGLPRRYL